MKNCLNCKNHQSKLVEKSIEPICSIGNHEQLQRFWNKLRPDDKNPPDVQCCEPLIFE